MAIPQRIDTMLLHSICSWTFSICDISHEITRTKRKDSHAKKLMLKKLWKTYTLVRDSLTEKGAF